MNGVLLLAMAWLPGADPVPSAAGPGCNCNQPAPAGALAPAAAKESFWQRRSSSGFFSKLRERFHKNEATAQSVPPAPAAVPASAWRQQPAPVTRPVVRNQPAAGVVLPSQTVLVPGPNPVSGGTVQPTTNEPPLN